MADAFGGDRPAAVCRELTKTHEEVRRGGLADLAGWAAAGVRGEVTIVVAGAVATSSVAGDADSLRTAVAAEEQAGTSRKDAIRAVAGRARAYPSARCTTRSTASGTGSRTASSEHDDEQGAGR